MKKTSPPITPGTVFGRWTVIDRASPIGVPHIYWNCRCECGSIKPVIALSLRNGKSSSCGCWLREVSGARATIHGLYRDPAFGVWTGMMGRCYGNTRRSHRYRDRGITVCDQWRASFERFLDDMGPRPSLRHSIDRIDNNGNYEPGNCRWATAHEQGGNTSKTRRITHEGETLCVAEWSRRTGLARATIIDRMDLGWSGADILTVKSRRWLQHTA